MTNDYVKPFAKDRSKEFEEAKIQVYAFTGVISCMLFGLLVVASALLFHKRKNRLSNVLREGGNPVVLNPLSTSSPQAEKWRNTYPNMIRSAAWFDSLNKSVQRHESFINPMISFKEDIKMVRRPSSSCQSKPTTMTDGSSLGSLGMEDEEENFEKHAKTALRKSKSFAHHGSFR